MPSWIEGHRLRCGPLTDAASIFGANLGVERDPPRGAPGLLALAKALERHSREPEPNEDDERVFVELAGAYLGALLCDALPDTRHEVRQGRHGLSLSAHGFFDPFAAVELALAAGDVRESLREQIGRVEATLAGPASSAAKRRAAARLREQVLPRLVGPAFFARLRAEHTGAPLHVLPLVSEVKLCFVVRSEGRARYLREDEAQWPDEPSEQLLHASLRNLAKQSERARLLRVDADEGVLVIASSGDGLDSSRLLLPGLHDVLAPELGSPFAAAVPHRDALFACSLTDTSALKSLRERAARESQNAAHAITPELLRVEGPGRLALLRL